MCIRDRISTKNELRDVLQQALGELSVLHVFVSIRSESPTLPVGEPSACLGASLTVKPKGLEVVYVYDTSGRYISVIFGQSPPCMSGS